MSWVHIEGVSTAWVDSCTRCLTLPRITHGKLMPLKINTNRAPVHPVPRPRAVWYAIPARKISLNWNTPEIFLEVITCLHEYAYEVMVQTGVESTDESFGQIATRDEFCRWWHEKVINFLTTC